MVGEYLGGLRSRGYRVFHDVVGPRFNLAPVLVGPTGVFTIETKTWSKPARGDARVVFDGQTLTVVDGTCMAGKQAVLSARGARERMVERHAQRAASTGRW